MMAADDLIWRWWGLTRVSPPAADLLAPLANERINTMNDTTIGLETEQEMLTHDISDEALETAGTEIAGNYTMFCSGIQCPG